MGTEINGIARIGFIIIGTPKSIGSLILNIPGIIDIFPIDFIWSFLLIIIAIQSPNVDPIPPI